MNRVLCLLISIVCAAACEERPSPAPPAERTQGVSTPEHVDEPAHDELPKLIRLSAQVIADAQIRARPVQRERLPSTLTLPGEIAADPDRSARLSSPIPGLIESVRFQEGDNVKQGALLATIAVPDLGKLRSDYASAAARAAAARSNAERLKQLLSQRLTAEQTYRDALAQAEALELEAQAARQHLQALGLTEERSKPSQLSLRAPFAGTVVSRNAVVGQPVLAGEVLGEIIDLTEVWFLGRVFEKDLGRLKQRASAEVELNAYPRERFEGMVEYIGQRVDPVARTVTARIRLQNRNELLRVGLFGNAHVALQEPATREPSLVVPRSALTEIGHKQVVFVQHPDGDFELHEVVLGRAATGKVEVVSGLREGERVVDQGVFTLKSAVLKSTFTEDEE